MSDIGQNFNFLISHTLIWPILGFLWVFGFERWIDALARRILGNIYGVRIDRVAVQIIRATSYRWEYFPLNNTIRRWSYFFNFIMPILNMVVLAVSFGMFLDSFKYYVQ